MTTYHILNGDCLADLLKNTDLNQNMIICRECLIEGPVNSTNLNEFWTIRAHFIADTYHISSEVYKEKTVRELEKLTSLPEDCEVCLWFEDDSFCQTNMWFVLSLLARKPTIKVYRVFPVSKDQSDQWRGYGTADVVSIQHSYNSRVYFTKMDMILGNDLWNAYRSNDFASLTTLSKRESACFHFLEEVCNAHVERFPVDNSPGRPERVIKEILETHSTDFIEVFTAFSKQEGIYGFSDLQIKTFYEKLLPVVRLNG